MKKAEVRNDKNTVNEKERLVIIEF